MSHVQPSSAPVNPNPTAKRRRRRADQPTPGQLELLVAIRRLEKQAERLERSRPGSLEHELAWFVSLSLGGALFLYNRARREGGTLETMLDEQVHTAHAILLWKPPAPAPAPPPDNVVSLADFRAARAVRP